VGGRRAVPLVELGAQLFAQLLDLPGLEGQ
jgi:hypothetical protein